MFNMNGYDVIWVIWEGKVGVMYKDVFIIVMIVNVMFGEKEKCLEVGMDDFVIKFVMVDVFIFKVK